MVVGMEMIAMGVISGRLKDEHFQCVFFDMGRIFYATNMARNETTICKQIVPQFLCITLKNWIIYFYFYLALDENHLISFVKSHNKFVLNLIMVQTFVSWTLCCWYSKMVFTRKENIHPNPFPGLTFMAIYIIMYTHVLES